MTYLLRTCVLTLLCLPLGCAALSDTYVMEEYGRTMDSYETAMRVSDFNVACRFVDSKVMDRAECLQRYENVKIASFAIISARVGDDNRKMDLTVEASYFLLDRYVVEKIQFEQSWQYQEASKRWLLTSAPPSF